MLKFNRLEPNKVYRVKDKFLIPVMGDKKIGRESLVTVLGESMSDTADFFKRDYIRFRNYRKYYIERFVKFTFMGRMIYQVNDQTEIYKTGFGLQYPEIALAKNPGIVNNYNAVYELNQYIELINNNEKFQRKPLLQKNPIRFNMIVERLKKISNEFPLHKKKYLFLPLDNYIPNPKDVTIWTKKSYLNNQMIGFLRMFQNDWKTIKTELPDWTFVFININELFFLECKDINSDTYMDMKKLFRKFKSKRGSIVTESSDPELELTEDEIDDPETSEKTNEINNKIINKVVTKTENVLEDTKLSKKEKEQIKSKIEDKLYDKKVEVQNKSSTIIKNEKKESKPIKKDDKSKDITKTIITKSKEKESSKEEDIGIENYTDKLKQVELEKISEDIVKEELFNKISPTLSPARMARVKKMQEDMGNIILNNKTLTQIKEEANSEMIEPMNVKADVMNEDIKTIPFSNFEKAYNKKLMEPDLINILTKFSEMDRPLYLISLNKEDTSTVMDKKYTYTAVYEDEMGRRHTLKFDYPKFVNHKYIHINNSDKLFINQVIPLPVTKVTPNQVQISSNYKKIFITRFGKNVSNKLIKFNKVIPDIDNRILKIDYGNNLKTNSPYMTTIEYDGLSQKYNSFEIPGQKITMYFDQEKIREICDQNNLKYTDDNIPIGIKELPDGKKEVILLDSSKDVVIGTNQSTIDYISSILNNEIEDFMQLMASSGSGKRLMYTRARIMKKDVPLVLLLAFLIGLEPLLNRLNVEYVFTETRPRLGTDFDKIVIEFKDGYLVYNGSKFSDALILNGLIDIPTKEYDFLQFSGKDIYFGIFSDLFGRRNIGNAFENFNQEFIDPITEEVLVHCKLPTNFIDLVIYANSLLENNVCDIDGDMANFRIRSNELVNAHLYQLLTKVYEKYRYTADNKNPQKFTIKQNALMNSIFDSQILEESSTLNPIFEIDRMRATSYKGIGGCNVDEAFKLEKRAYNDSMLGIFAQSSPISSNVGISRVLALNPNVKSLRGYIEPGSIEKSKELNQTNMLSGAELLVPMTATHDDPQRVSMASTQSRHTISTVDSDTPLFGYGFDKVIANTISDRFAFKAKDNGVVAELDEKLGYMIIKYDNEEPDVVDLTNKQALNTGSGFYINNKLVANVKVGDRVYDGQVVASNRDFFNYNEVTGDTVYKSGPLARVAVIHGSAVFEDSTIMTEEFAEKMSSYVTEMRDILLGENSNIYSMVKIGDEVTVNDSLMVFDESYEDEYLNKLLAAMAAEEKEDIIDSGRTAISSKWNGKVVDIKIYYTVPKNQLSESLQNIINDYERDIKKRLKAFKDNGINIKDMVTLNDEAKFIEPVNGKVEGVKMGDKKVLIKIYVQTLDKFSGGDKCTYSTALKGINQTLIPKGQQPYLASDPNEKIDAFMSISGYYSRMTNSFPITLALNSVLIGAEKKIKDILEK